ncbi:hypothetical protein N9V83_03300, partial [Flavobacteriales bacterium]|nr:hypothetical protein [Flavobacteriales bacterium]
MKKLGYIFLMFIGSFTFAQNTLLSEDFEDESNNTAVTQVVGTTYQIDNADADCGANDNWRISTADATGASCSGCSSQRALIDYGPSDCAQDAMMIVGSFTPSTSTVSISFNYGFDNYDDPGAEFFIATLYNETDGTTDATLVNTSVDDEDASYSASTAVSAGDTYSLRFQYIAEFDWGATVDNILVTEICSPAATFTTTCNPDLTYTLDVNITDLGSSTVRVNDGTSDLETGINATGLRSYAGLSGSKTYYVINESTPACDISQAITACTACDVLSVTYGAQDCQSDLTYNVDVTINTLATGETVKITDGSSDLQTGISSAGTYTISGLTGALSLSVIDEADASCTNTSSAFSACDVCSISSAPDDECAGASLIDLGQEFYGSTACSYTSSSQGDPSGYCGVDYRSIGTMNDNDSWIEFVAGATTVEIDVDVAQSAANPGLCANGIQLAVYSGSCGSLTVIPCTIENPSPTPNVNTTVDWEIPGLTIGDTYIIRIDGYAGDQCDYAFDPQSGVVVTPPNDDCASATSLTCNGATDTQSIIFATATDAPTTCAGDATTEGNWYTFTGDGGDYTISTDNAGTNFDTQINVYSGSCGALVCVGSDLDSGTGETSEYTFTTTNATTYYVYVDGEGTAEGQYEISLACTACVAPSVDTETLGTQSVCEGGSPTALSITASGTNITYQWYSDTDNDASGGTSLGAGAQTNSYTPSGASAGTTYYYVVVSGDCGTATSSASGAIIVNGLPTATVSPDPAEVCEGTTLALDGNPAGGSGTYTTHAWSGDVGHLDNTAIQAPTVQATATATTYNMTYTVTDDNGCQGSDAIAVVVNGLPTATVSPDPAEVCEGTTLALDGNPAGGSGTYTTHAWIGDVGHLDNTAIQAPTVQATATATTYNMTYTVTDDNGCQASDAIAVVVNDIPVISSSVSSSPSSCGASDGSIEVV